MDSKSLRDELRKRNVAELRKIAREVALEGRASLTKKEDLVENLAVQGWDRLRKSLNKTWWDKHQFAVFGWSSVVGVVLTLPSIFLWPNESVSDNSNFNAAGDAATISALSRVRSSSEHDRDGATSREMDSDVITPSNQGEKWERIDPLACPDFLGPIRQVLTGETDPLSPFLRHKLSVLRTELSYETPHVDRIAFLSPSYTTKDAPQRLTIDSSKDALIAAYLLDEYNKRSWMLRDITTLDSATDCGIDDLSVNGQIRIVVLVFPLSASGYEGVREIETFTSIAFLRASGE